MKLSNLKKILEEYGSQTQKNCFNRLARSLKLCNKTLNNPQITFVLSGGVYPPFPPPSPSSHETLTANTIEEIYKHKDVDDYFIWDKVDSLKIKNKCTNGGWPKAELKTWECKGYITRPLATSNYTCIILTHINGETVCDMPKDVLKQNNLCMTLRESKNLKRCRDIRHNVYMYFYKLYESNTYTFDKRNKNVKFKAIKNRINYSDSINNYYLHVTLTPNQKKLLSDNKVNLNNNIECSFDVLLSKHYFHFTPKKCYVCAPVQNIFAQHNGSKIELLALKTETESHITLYTLEECGQTASIEKIPPVKTKGKNRKIKFKRKSNCQRFKEMNALMQSIYTDKLPPLPPEDIK